MHPHRDRKTRASALAALVEVAAEARRVYPRGRVRDLEPATLQVLLAVDLLGQPTVGELATRLVLTPQAVSGALRRLRELELVETKVSREDRRQRTARISEKGSRRVDEFLQKPAQS